MFVKFLAEGLMFTVAAPPTKSTGHRDVGDRVLDVDGVTPTLGEDVEFSRPRIGSTSSSPH